MQDPLSLAETLRRHGLYRSALRLLDARPDIHGQRANSLRRLLQRNAVARSTPAGIYLLAVAEPASTGCVVPVRAERGMFSSSVGPFGWRGSACEQEFRRVLDWAKQALISSHHLPELGLFLPEGISLSGASSALPACLAYVEKWSGKRVQVPVLATGEMDAAGNILAVQDLPAKIDAALAELADCPGLVLFPAAQVAETAQWPADRLKPVRTLEEAVRAVWSEYPLGADRSLLSLEATLQEAQNVQDPRQALSILDSHPEKGLAEADLARLLFAKGCQYRHLGLSEEAAQLHERARKLLEGSEGAIGRQAVETFEMEAFATEMDLFAFESLEPALRARLREPFLADHNKVRCQGMLAQLLSTVGRHEEAVRLRQSNLAIQKASEAMRREIPRTLACLAYESARGGMADRFEKTVADLFEGTAPGDSVQVRYNLCAVARGLTILGRHRDLLDWGHGRSRLWERIADPELVRLVTGEVVRFQPTHPEVSTLRAVVRALRRAGEYDRAIELASGLELGDRGRADLVYWLAALVAVEWALALSDSGRTGEAQRVIALATERLKSYHPQAAGFYSALLSELEKGVLDGESVKKIETELDLVYY